MFRTLRSRVSRIRLLCVSMLLALASSHVQARISVQTTTQPHAQAQPQTSPRPLFLVHYMPWFETNPAAGAFGWHWTMNAFSPPGSLHPDPARPPGIASHYNPLIGPYDSSYPEVIEYHLLLMKAAGIDGLIVDWYGLANHLDYPINHKRTQLLFETAAQFGLQLAVCYEDQTIPKLVAAGKLPPAERVKHALQELNWLQSHWFSQPHYLKHEGKPVLLSFGFDGLSDPEWAQVWTQFSHPICYLSQHRLRPGASGVFDWPVPREGIPATTRFLAQAATDRWPTFLPVAYPRFHDIYAEAKVQPSYGRIPDDNGNTLESTLQAALDSRAPFLQIATWNDWGEGTQIEPSRQFLFRDLELIQSSKQNLMNKRLPFDPAAFPLIHRLYLLRRNQHTQPGLKPRLDAAARHLAAGQGNQAGLILKQLEHGNHRPGVLDQSSIGYPVSSAVTSGSSIQVHEHASDHHPSASHVSHIVHLLNRFCNVPPPHNAPDRPDHSGSTQRSQGTPYTQYPAQAGWPSP